jgi:DNA gyrase subunit A
MGRNARGVRGMRLLEGQTLISLVVAKDPSLTVLTATENGYGKRTPVGDYPRHGRGTQGTISIQTSERNGKVVAARLVSPTDEVMLITTGGVLIRTRVAEIREMGRVTQGVTLIGLDTGEKLAGLERVVETDEGGPEVDGNGGTADDGGADGSAGGNGDAAAGDEGGSV